LPIIIDFILLNLAFFVCNYLKRGFFYLLPGYGKLLLLFYLCWIFSSYIGTKFRESNYSSYSRLFVIVTRSTFYLTYSIAFIVVIFGFDDYSRIHVFSTCLCLWVFETGIAFVVRKSFTMYRTDNKSKAKSTEAAKRQYGSFILVLIDFFMVFFSFFIANYIKRGHFNLLPHYDKLLLLIYGVWFLSALITKKYYLRDSLTFSFYFWQWIKASILMVSILSILVYGLRLFYFSRFQVFGTILALINIEMIVLFIYWWIRIEKQKHDDIDSVEKVRSIIGQEDIPLNVDIEALRKELIGPARFKLQRKLKQNYSELFEFIDQYIDLDELLSLESTVGQSSDPYILNMDESPTRLFLNLCKINDIRRLNRYFLQIHKKLLPGGYYISWAHTIKTHREWVYDRFPRPIANIYYLFEFCYKRIMPKLPVLKAAYFAITKGRNRIISRAEVLGRLSFCGFEIIAEREIKKRLCFITRKAKTPSLDENPTYGPLITLKRAGENNKILHIHKFRTMHPYSEYLQKYVYDNQGLKKGGKLDNDFRMTAWGTAMRKLWLDELPMLYNWVVGDIQLVGVRPLSIHFLNLYDKELQDLRKNIKPGLIPPYYADLPNGFEEICLSEKKYIKRYMKHPLKTQWIYFWNAFFNIVVRGARSA